jgi:hypothetical protein
LDTVKYDQDLAPISPLEGEMSPSSATERGNFPTAFTPTLYPSPQGGGGLLHPAKFLRLDIKRKNQKTKFDVYIPLPLVGRDTGWGYHSNGVFHA